MKSGEHVLFDAYMMTGPDRSWGAYLADRLARLTREYGQAWARFLVSAEAAAARMGAMLDALARRP